MSLFFSDLFSLLPDYGCAWPVSYPPPRSPLQGELQLLCMQLDRHISTHIRESPQAMHRTKLKDLAAQTYIRWQELLTHCQPQVVPPSSPQTWEGREVVRRLTSNNSESTPTTAAELLAGRWVERAVWGRVETPQRTFIILIKSPVRSVGM